MVASLPLERCSALRRLRQQQARAAVLQVQRALQARRVQQVLVAKRSVEVLAPLVVVAGLVVRALASSKCPEVGPQVPAVDAARALHVIGK